MILGWFKGTFFGFEFWELGRPPPPCWEKFPNNSVIFFWRLPLVPAGSESFGSTREKHLQVQPFLVRVRFLEKLEVVALGFRLKCKSEGLIYTAAVWAENKQTVGPQALNWVGDKSQRFFLRQTWIPTNRSISLDKLESENLPAAGRLMAKTDRGFLHSTPRPLPAQRSAAVIDLQRIGELRREWDASLPKLLG